MLLQELMSCWTECAPGQLAAGPELTAVQCMEATLQCVDMLLHQLPSLFPTGRVTKLTSPTYSIYRLCHDTQALGNADVIPTSSESYIDHWCSCSMYGTEDMGLTSALPSA